MASGSSVDRLRPLLRTILPALLYAASMEMVIGRIIAPRHGLFAVPGRHANPLLVKLLAQIDVTLFHFALVMAVAVIVLLGMAALTGPRNSAGVPWVGPGLILLGVWSLARFVLDTPALELAYLFLSLALALSILFQLFGTADRRSGRAFAVLAAATLACGAYVVVSQILAQMGGAPLGFELAVRRAGELLALGCGTLVPTLIPWNRQADDHQRSFPPVLLASVPAGLFLLLFFRRALRPLEPHRWSLGWSWELPLPDELLGLLYAGVLFLFFFALFRALWEPRWRLRGYGLAFLFLAGLHYRISYQHLLALMGLLLICHGGESRRRASAT